MSYTTCRVKNDEKPEICSQDLTTLKLFTTSDEFSGVMAAEATQQEAEGRVRAEKVGSEYRSRPLKGQMEAQDYITTS